MRKTLFLLLFLLAGCTVIIGTYNPSTQTTTKGCDKFIPPVVPPMPDVPVIPKELVHNKDAAENILVANIGDLREYIKKMKAEYQKAADLQLKSCQ